MQTYKCPFCGGSTIWQSDFGLDETHSRLGCDGVSSTWFCQECNLLLDFIFVETEKGLELKMIMPIEDNEEE